MISMFFLSSTYANECVISGVYYEFKHPDSHLVLVPEKQKLQVSRLRKDDYAVQSQRIGLLNCNTCFNCSLKDHCIGIGPHNRPALSWFLKSLVEY